MLCVLFAATALLRRNAKVRWAINDAMPEISRLADKGESVKAFAIASQAEEYIAGHPPFRKLWSDISWTPSIRTVPAGAELYYKDYSSPTSIWRYGGRTPVASLRVPLGDLRWQLRKQGFATVDTVLSAYDWEPLFPGARTETWEYVLDEAKTIPSDMVRVRGGKVDSGIQLPDYLVGRFEVTNRQFKTFVDAGGYNRPQYWVSEFIDNGRPVAREQAMARFRDRTGRQGPATWDVGEYPEGKADHPVTGVSWYEAAAYAAFAGMSLPTVHHWKRAAGTSIAHAVVPLSNFSGRGLASVGAYQGMGPFGIYDMAGNAKEWCWNEAAAGIRYSMGGGWNEPSYMFEEPDATSAFDRSPANGFRCVKYLDQEQPPTASMQRIIRVRRRDFLKEQPVSDTMFKVYASVYRYDASPLEAATQSVDDADPRWRKETVSFRAAYGKRAVLPRICTCPRRPSRRIKR